MSSRNALIFVLVACGAAALALILLQEPPVEPQAPAQPPAAETPGVRNPVGLEPLPPVATGDPEPAPVPPATVEEQPPAAPVEDAMFPTAFVEDLAAFVVASYVPDGLAEAPATPPLTWKRLNTRYGLDTSHFGHGEADVAAARQTVFEYALAPAMIRTLAALYTDYLVDELADRITRQRYVLQQGDATAVRPLTTAERSVFLTRTAGFVRGGAKVLAVVAPNPAFRSHLENLEQAEAEVRAAYTALESAQESGQDVDAAGRKLRRALQAREDVRAVLVARVRQRSAGLPSQMSDEDVLYVASWTLRRLEGHPERAEALSTAAVMLAKLARRLDDKAAQLQGAS